MSYTLAWVFAEIDAMIAERAKNAYQIHADLRISPDVREARVGIEVARKNELQQLRERLSARQSKARARAA